jgi:hypothetical protein
MYSRSLSPLLKDRPRRTLDAREDVVGEDWIRDEPELGATLVAPRTINTTRRILWGFVIAAFVFFIGAVGFFIYFFSFGSGSGASSPSKIDIVVLGPSQIASGEVTELQIAVTNKNTSPLNLAGLLVSYPPGTRSPTDFVTPQLSYPIDLGTIAPGETKQGTVKAVFSGTTGGHGSIKAALDYHLNGSNSIFTASSDYAFTFSSSPLLISVDGNTETISGQPIQFTASVQSNATKPIKDALLHADFPFGFQFSSSAPTPIAPGLWSLGTLNPGGKQSITINGVLTGETGDSRVFNFTTGTRTNSASTTIDVPLATNPFPVNISNPFMGLAVAVNESTGPNTVVAPGDVVTVTVHYKNNLSTSITDAVVVAKLSGFEIDGSTVSSANGFYRSNDNTILWNKTTTNGDLSLLKPGAEGTLTFTFRSPGSDVLQNTTNPSISIAINAAGNRVSESGVPQNLQSVASKSIIIASNFTLTANGLYYASPYGSVGPIPPKSGVETTYAMVFTITNTTNEIKNAVLTATLPPYVRTTGKVSPNYEHVKFNQSTGQVTWDVGSIVRGVGTNGVQPRQLAFEIGFTPSTSQIGQTPTLMQNIKLTGTDASTEQTVTQSAPNVTTNLVGDTGFNSTSATVVK